MLNAIHGREDDVNANSVQITVLQIGPLTFIRHFQELPDP